MELVVVLALLGLIAGVSAFALGGLRVGQEAGTDVIRTARSQAIREGAPVRVSIPAARAESAPSFILLLPDGRAVGRGVDPLLGGRIEE